MNTGADSGRFGFLAGQLTQTVQTELFGAHHPTVQL